MPDIAITFSAGIPTLSAVVATRGDGYVIEQIKRLKTAVAKALQIGTQLPPSRVRDAYFKSHVPDDTYLTYRISAMMPLSRQTEYRNVGVQRPAGGPASKVSEDNFTFYRTEFYVDVFGQYSQGYAMNFETWIISELGRDYARENSDHTFQWGATQMVYQLDDRLYPYAVGDLTATASDARERFTFKVWVYHSWLRSEEHDAIDSLWSGFDVLGLQPDSNDDLYPIVTE